MPRHFALVIIPWLLFAAVWVGKEEKKESGNNKLSHVDADSVFDTGKKVFYASCFSCHKDSLITLAPGPGVLSAMTPRAVLASLENGKMRIQASKLSPFERRAVAQWVTQARLKENELPKEAFMPFSKLSTEALPFDYSGWGGDLEGTGFRSARVAGITETNISSLKLKWAFAFPDATQIRCKPALAGDWLIAGSQFGDVFAINRHSGKLGWHFTAASAIRGAIVVTRNGNSLTAYFADYTTLVYALDVKTGKLIWSKRAGYESQSANTGSVAVYNGIVYVPITSLEVALAANGNYPCCVSSGGLVALDARSGNLIWKHRMVEEIARESGKNKNGKPFYGPSGAPVWCSPTIDSKRGTIYIGSGENYSYPATKTSDAIQALDLKTGRLKWTFQATSGDAYNTACPFLNNCPTNPGPDLDFGMAPILVKRKNGRDILVVGQKSGVVYALDPDLGKIIWKRRIGKGGALGGIHWGMATDGKYVYAANADNFYGVDRKDSSFPVSPGLYALDLSQGELVWKTASPPCTEKKGCLPANSAAPAVIPGMVFAGTLDGHIRAYRSADGKIIWDYDTAKPFETANGISGKGGSLDGPAPVIADGMLFVNSGYGLFGQIPGNVLLAFEVDKNK